MFVDIQCDYCQSRKYLEFATDDGSECKSLILCAECSQEPKKYSQRYGTLDEFFCDPYCQECGEGEDLLNPFEKKGSCQVRCKNCIPKLTPLDITNAHPRDKCIRFQEEGHKYFINESLLTNPLSTTINDSYKSVTTFIHDLFPEFETDKVITNMMKSKNWVNSKYFGMTRQEIKQNWGDNAKVASELGTKLHNDIEKFYNGIPPNNTTKEWSFFKNFLKDHSDFKPYRTEWTLWDAESRICGSVDMIFLNENGTLTIYDWKRSKEIKMENRFQKGQNKHVKNLDDCNYEHYSLQLNIYKYLVEKNYGFKVSELAIVVFHPRNENYKKYPVRNLQNLVKNLIDDRIDKLLDKKLINDRIVFIDEDTGLPI